MMVDGITDLTTLRPEELEAVYAISRTVAQAMDVESVLDDIIRLTRPVFIFDNMVVYTLRPSQGLDASYARAIGRGRSQEADLVWGESTAQAVLDDGDKVIRKEEMGDSTQNRLYLRYSLGLPLVWGGESIGALVFIRFGGPSFSSDQIRLSEFIALHVAQLMGHKKLVQRIASLEAERRLDRLQEDFIATVSHELLTPLGFIKGYATTLLREDTVWDNETRFEFLTIIDEEADHLRELIESLMDSSRLQAGTLRMSFQPVRLDVLLKDIELRARSQDKQLKVNLDIRTPPLSVPADPTRLAQVMDNLVSNAMKYAPGSDLLLRLESEEPWAVITVADKGPGIPPEHVKNLFKRFYRVPSGSTTVRGTGLGLFICRRITQAHGGTIRVESKLNEGTTFIIRLPLKKTQAEDSISLRESG